MQITGLENTQNTREKVWEEKLLTQTLYVCNDMPLSLLHGPKRYGRI